jgi:hypothetical protein
MCARRFGRSVRLHSCARSHQLGYFAFSFLRRSGTTEAGRQFSGSTRVVHPFKDPVPLSNSLLVARKLLYLPCVFRNAVKLCSLTAGTIARNLVATYK